MALSSSKNNELIIKSWTNAAFRNMDKLQRYCVESKNQTLKNIEKTQHSEEEKVVNSSRRM